MRPIGRKGFSHQNDFQVKRFISFSSPVDDQLICAAEFELLQCVEDMRFAALHSPHLRKIYQTLKLDCPIFPLKRGSTIEVIR